MTARLRAERIESVRDWVSYTYPREHPTDERDQDLETFDALVADAAKLAPYEELVAASLAIIPLWEEDEMIPDEFNESNPVMARFMRAVFALKAAKGEG